ncbi:helix-turn-helix transcriptional regulator [Microbacterium lacus]|uniref:helix-turn-helix domain-containing protein n=1 Tax=Microbacterium lacus TaxID=415217 RepID=UPI00384F56CD
MSHAPKVEAEIRRPSDLGPIIARVREAQGISQAQLAESAGFSRTYLAGLESGKPVIQLARLFTALRTLGIRVNISFDMPAPHDHDEARDND